MKISKLTHTLACSYTGVVLGKLDLTVTAGHIPYMSHWNEMVCHHALFSLQQPELCKHMTQEWVRLSRLIADETATEVETTNLQVGFVALLHRLGSIRQDRGCLSLPSIQIVQRNLESTIALNYWQSYLASKRFNFPELHISKLNDNSAMEYIHDYLAVCWKRKEDYEKNIDEVQELERSKIAERALLVIRNSWIKPTGKRLLWQYCLGYLGGQWAIDSANWMRHIFLSTPASIIAWDKDEITLLEDILEANLPGGVITHAVRQRVQDIKQSWKDHYDTFSIEEDDLEFVEGLKTELQQTPCPIESAYPNKAQFFVAKAKWELANPVVPVSKDDNILNAAKKKLDKQLDDEEDNDNEY